MAHITFLLDSAVSEGPSGVYKASGYLTELIKSQNLSKSALHDLNIIPSINIFKHVLHLF